MKNKVVLLNNLCNMSNSVTDRINQENTAKYGKPCEVCFMYKHSCRCNYKIPQPMNYIEFKSNAKRTFSSVTELYGNMNPELENKLQCLHCIVGIATEVDELEAALMKADMVNLKEEIGDIMWYVANYENALDQELSDLEDVLLLADAYNIYNLKESSDKLLDLWKKKLFYNTDKHDSTIDNEFAYLKHSIVKFCNNSNFDITSIMETNIEKLKARYPDKFSTRNADNRDLDNERNILEK